MGRKKLNQSAIIEGDIAKIPLRGGGFALVDKEFAYLAELYTWRMHTNGAAIATFARADGISKYMHRHILPTEEGFEVDHINHNRLDNRSINLRSVTKTDNARNKRIYKNNTSGAKGVDYIASTDRWRAFVRYKGKALYQRTFKTSDEAIAARRAFIDDYCKKNNVKIWI